MPRVPAAMPRQGNVGGRVRRPGPSHHQANQNQPPNSRHQYLMVSPSSAGAQPRRDQPTIETALFPPCRTPELILQVQQALLRRRRLPPRSAATTAVTVTTARPAQVNWSVRHILTGISRGGSVSITQLQTTTTAPSTPATPATSEPSPTHPRHRRNGVVPVLLTVGRRESIGKYDAPGTVGGVSDDIGQYGDAQQQIHHRRHLIRAQYGYLRR